MLSAAQQLDFEGIVAKRKTDPYAAETVVVQDQEPGVHAGGRQMGAVQPQATRPASTQPSLWMAPKCLRSQQRQATISDVSGGRP